MVYFQNIISAHIHLSNRYGNLLREFDRNQKSTVRRVENIFDKCHRDISLALIDMKIDLAYSSSKTRWKLNLTIFYSQGAIKGNTFDFRNFTVE